MQCPVAFTGTNQDSCILKIWSFVSTYTYACVLLGYCVYFIEAMLQRSIPLTAADGDAVSLYGSIATSDNRALT